MATSGRPNSSRVFNTQIILRRELDNLTKSTDEEQKNLNGEIANLQASVATLNEDTDTLDASVTTLNETVDTLESSVSDLSTKEDYVMSTLSTDVLKLKDGGGGVDSLYIHDSSDVSRGIFYNTENGMGLATDFLKGSVQTGCQNLRMNSVGSEANITLYDSGSNVVRESLTFNNTSITTPGNLSVGTASSNQWIRTSIGTSSAPGFSFTQATNTGLNFGSSNLNLVHSGSVRVAINNVTVTNNVTQRNLNGTQEVPSISFTSDTDTGLFSAGENAIGFSAGATEAMRVSSAGLTIGVGSPPIHWVRRFTPNAIQIGTNSTYTATYTGLSYPSSNYIVLHEIINFGGSEYMQGLQIQSGRTANQFGIIIRNQSGVIGTFIINFLIIGFG
jgi:hypothetical protein